MKRSQVIRAFCRIQALVLHSTCTDKKCNVGTADGFCSKCRRQQGRYWNYLNDGLAIDYIRKATLEKLKADGFKISPGFDRDTGKEVDPETGKEMP